MKHQRLSPRAPTAVLKPSSLVCAIVAALLSSLSIRAQMAAAAPVELSTSTFSGLPDAPSSMLPRAEMPGPSGVADEAGASGQVSALGLPKRVLVDEVHVLTSPTRLRKHDLVWLLPVAAATGASLATDTRVSRDVVSHNPDFNAAANTSSNVLRGVFIGGPVVLFGAGQFLGNARAREAGLLAGEAMIDGYITSEGIKYVTLRERPALKNARGHFWSGDAASDPSFVSGHSIVAWSSAAVLAGEYPRLWQQATFYTLASGVSLTRVLGQDHFPSDVLVGAVAGWLIGHYVYRGHHHLPKR